MASRVDARTADRLRRFKSALTDTPTADEKVLSELDALTKDVPDQDLPLVTSFATADENAAVAWPLVRLLVDRNRLNDAADVAITALTRQPDGRKYRMWKWWEYNFGERTDYRRLSNDFAEGLLKQFEIGTADRKQVVCEVFGKDQSHARLTAAEFRKKLYPKAAG